MLSKRREDILRVIVKEYVLTGTPVSSETVARRGLKASTATIRNEMLQLEEEGYLIQPHTSAGRIPSDLGYRHYIQALMGYAQLSLADQRLIRHQFYQVEREVEEWIRLAAAILSRMLQNVAIVTLPKPYEARLKHLELVSLHDYLALLVVVLREAKIRQQMLAFGEPKSQEELSATAQKLTSYLAGLTRAQILKRINEAMELSATEDQVARAVLQIMLAEEAEAYEEPYVDGLRHILAHPDFSSSTKLAAIVELLEQRSQLKLLIPQLLRSEGLQILVGREINQDAMQNCSLIMSRYGIPDEVLGAIGVLGSTRMEYERAIPAVSYVSSIMSELVSELYG